MSYCKLISLLLLIPSLAFGQGKINGGLRSDASFMALKTGTLQSLVAAAGGAYPIDATISFSGGISCDVTLTSSTKTDTVNFVFKKPCTFDIPDNASVDTITTVISNHGARIAVSEIQKTTVPFSYSQLPSQLTGSVNVGTISVNTNIPMLQHLYEATIGASLTLTASNGVPGQVVYLVFVTSGTTSRTVTLGTGFRGTALATGTTSGKHFMAEFVWNDIDNVWDENGSPVAR